MLPSNPSADQLRESVQNMEEFPKYLLLTFILKNFWCRVPISNCIDYDYVHIQGFLY